MDKREELIFRYNNLKEQGVIRSDAQAAKNIGEYGPAVLSQYLKGTYPGNTSKFEAAFDAMLRREEDRSIDAYDEPFQEIKTWFVVKGICDRVLRMQTFGAIFGESGYGKTSSLQHYAELNPGVIYVEVDTSHSPKELMRTLLDHLGGSFTASLNTLEKEVIQRLKGSGRMVIIDQAESLNERALDLLRTVRDKAKCAVLIAGTIDLQNKLRGRSGIKQQITTRIGAFAALKRLEEDDFKTICDSLTPNESVDWQWFWAYKPENIRTLVNLIKASREIARVEGGNINKTTVKKAWSSLLHDSLK